LNVLEGKVIGSCYPLHRNIEFGKFLRQIDRETPEELAIHMILGNYGPPEQKDKKIRKERPKAWPSWRNDETSSEHGCFAPLRCSWKEGLGLSCRPQLLNYRGRPQSVTKTPQGIVVV
jgi:hypothetical protein